MNGQMLNEFKFPPFHRFKVFVSLHHAKHTKVRFHIRAGSKQSLKLILRKKLQCVFHPRRGRLATKWKKVFFLSLHPKTAQKLRQQQDRHRRYEFSNLNLSLSSHSDWTQLPASNVCEWIRARFSRSFRKFHVRWSRQLTVLTDSQTNYWIMIMATWIIAH